MSSNLHQAGVKLLKQLGRHADIIMDAYLAGSLNEDAHDPSVVEKLKQAGILWRPEPDLDDSILWVTRIHGGCRNRSGGEVLRRMERRGAADVPARVGRAPVGTGSGRPLPGPDRAERR